MWNSTFEIGTSETLTVLLALLPGFVTAEIIRALTVREQRSPFERVIQGLFFTFVDHASWMIVKWMTLDFIAMLADRADGSAPAYNLVGLFVCAVGWGIFGTWILNEGKLHRLLRNPRVGLTKSAARPNQWYDAFYRQRNHVYVVVHLKNKRRIYGWPRLFPDNSDHGHLFLMNARWLGGKHEDTGRLVSMLIDARNIEVVEFVPFEQGQEHE